MLYLEYLEPSFISDKEIYRAVENGDVESLKKLLENRQNKNPWIDEEFHGTNQSVLHVAAKLGQLGIIQWYRDNQEVLNITDMNPHDSTKFNTPMILAILWEELNIIDDYIENEREEVWNKASDHRGEYLSLLESNTCKFGTTWGWALYE